MSNVLPIRFMTEEQYTELKTNGTVTGNGNTITDDENALNLTPDTTDYKIEQLNAEITDLKDQLANVPKYYRHKTQVTLDIGTLWYSNCNSQPTAYATAWEWATSAGINGSVSVFEPCILNLKDESVQTYKQVIMIRFAMASLDDDTAAFIYIIDGEVVEETVTITEITDKVWG